MTRPWPRPAAFPSAHTRAEGGDTASRRRRASFAMLTGMIALAVGMPARADQVRDLGGVKALGTLELPSPKLEPRTPQILGVFPGTRTLLLSYMRILEREHLFIRTYDLNSPVPRPVRDFDIGPSFGGGYSVPITSFDAKRRRLFFLGSNSTTTGGSITVVDFDSMKVTQTLDIGSKLPGFIPAALTYSEVDDRFYVLGEMRGDLEFSYEVFGPYTFTVAPLAPVVVVALDGRAPDVAVEWVRPVPQCQSVMYAGQGGGGAKIERSTLRPALYWACASPNHYPGLSGVLRMAIMPSATQDQALTFSVEFFPITGEYVAHVPDGFSQGVTTFDHATDRLFVKSISTATPGVWVFDGRLSSWVGQIAAPKAALGMGFNPALGNLYLSTPYAGDDPAKDTSFLLVTDGRADPAPQGTLFPHMYGKGSTSPLIFTDPGSNRFFLQVNSAALGFPQTYGAWAFLVLEDDIEVGLPQIPPDPDDLTRDIPEGPGTQTDFSGSTSGFGFHASLVGGYGGFTPVADYELKGLGGVHGVVGQTAPAFAVLPGSVPNPGSTEPGDRGLWLARSPIVDLRTVGATAGAQSVAGDSLTANNFSIYADAARAAAGPPSQKPRAAAAAPLDEPTEKQRKDAAEEIDWPWQSTSCLDGGGGALKPAPAPGPGGAAQVECDLSGQRARATTSQKALALTDDPVNITVGAASYDSAATRTTEKGSVTDTTAESDGISISVKGVGEITIHRVIATAHSQAHGRPGTAHIAYTRVIENAKITSADGTVLYECGECDPNTLASEANTVFESHLRFSVPTGEMLATPRGAFAGFQRTRSQHLEALTVNNDDALSMPALEALVIRDGPQKSRLLLQFASLRANSIYVISPLPALAPETPQRLAGPEFIPTPAESASPAPPPEGPTGVPGPIYRTIRSALLLIRSPTHMLLVALTWSLMGLAALAFARRRELMGLLEEEA